ncbi:sigma-54 interaction domain-containing protein [Candidatus Magnetominusculus dajiuhuensis]|uniref:sigma-54 interaction domain-containing protein n=1 Tax=Candidatus Magnetominusculus dajiuhuensis TaxID=3137712 RepID=UPI003B42C1A1
MNTTESCEAIRRNRNDLLAILNQLRVGTIMLDEHGNTLFASNPVLNIFGKTADETAGMPIEKLVRTNRGDLFQSIADNRAGRFTLEADSPEGRHFWLEVEAVEDPEDARRKILFLYDVSEVYGLRKLLKGNAGFHGIIGKGPAIEKVFAQIKSIASAYWTVLIEGETGTGKELAARAIHSLGSRKDKPFIAVNCAGLTDSLLASQLFGHTKGAFTGAVSAHKGVFEAAEGGTVFLDEIGDISMNVQANLLRFLESHEITVLGESVSKTVDVRIITATNKSLSEEVQKGAFRADLLYRIRVARIALPPLRERREDIPLLASHFLSVAAVFSGKKITEISAGAMALLLAYSWPGNVRELRSAVDFAVIHSEASVIRPGDLPPEISNSTEETSYLPLEGIKDEHERFLEALRQSNGNRSRAARLLGISRATFYRHFSLIER